MVDIQMPGGPVPTTFDEALQAGGRGSRFVHDKADPDIFRGADHDWALDMAGDAQPNYLRWIATMCEPYLGRSVLELGAGHGSVTQHFATGRRIVAIDGSDACVAAMNRRFRDMPNVRVLHGDLRNLDLADQFDSVVLINVLEHIYDDADTLRSFLPYLRPGGRVVLYVPAFNALFGHWDRRVGHFRRYSRGRLRAVMIEAGLRPVVLRYANLLAVPGWLVFSQLARVDDTAGKGLSIWDRTGTPVGRFLESKVPVPLGLNLLGVGEPV